MKAAKGEVNNSGPKMKLDVDIDATVMEKLKTMEQYAKVPMEEMVTTALKRYIASHKDYLPGGLNQL